MGYRVGAGNLGIFSYSSLGDVGSDTVFVAHLVASMFCFDAVVRESRCVLAPELVVGAWMEHRLSQVAVCFIC